MSGNRQQQFPRRGFTRQLCLLALCSLPACGGSDLVTPRSRQVVLEDEVTYHVHYIDLSLRSGEAQAVRELYAARLEQHPRDPTALFLAGRTQAEPNAAFLLYEQALTLAPDSYWANLGLGEAYLHLGILHRAEERLQRTVRLDETLPFGHASLGEVYRQKGLRKQAVESFHRALEQDSGCFVAHRGLAEIYLDSGNRRSARRELEAAASLAPTMFDLRYKLAELQEEEGLLEQAAASYGEACRIHPNQAKAWYGQARTARALKQPAEAIRALERVLELQSYHHAARKELADLLKEQGQTARADQLYREVLAAQPEDRQARWGQAQSFEQQGRLADALLAYRELMQLHPGDEPSQQRFGELIGRLGAQPEPVSGRTLQQTFDRALQAIQGCHRHLKSGQPALAGTLLTQVALGEEGKAVEVTVSEDTTHSPELKECALWTLRTAAFPVYQPATVTFPVTLR